MTILGFDFLVIALAAWRLAFMISHERGPFGVFETLRARLPLGGLTSCIFCLSVWTAGTCLLLWYTPLAVLVAVLALSAAALMLASWTGLMVYVEGNQK